MASRIASQESARFTVHPSLDRLELLAARYRDHAYALHTHPTFVFGVVTAGVERLRVGRRESFAGPGSIIVVNPEEPHDGEKGCDDGWSYRTCYPSVGLIREIADDLGLPGLPLFPSAVLAAPDLAQAFAAAHDRASRGGALDSEAGLLLALRGIVARFGHIGGRGDAAQPAASAARVEAYDAVIAADPAAAVDLSALAAAAGVTRFQVIRDFKREAAMTPGQYLRDRRVRRACALIGAGLPLAAVAAEAGFADQSHLTRAFKAVKGVTPAAWRRALFPLVSSSRTQRRSREDPGPTR